MTAEELVRHIIEAYITVLGQEKWNSLTAQEQHDVIMTIIKEGLKDDAEGN
jgi:hypothetical protein